MPHKTPSRSVDDVRRRTYSSTPRADSLSYCVKRQILACIHSRGARVSRPKHFPCIVVRVQNPRIELPLRVLGRSLLTTYPQTFSLTLSILLVSLINISSAWAQVVVDQAPKLETHANSLPQSSEPTGADRCLFCHPA